MTFGFSSMETIGDLEQFSAAERCNCSSGVQKRMEGREWKQQIQAFAAAKSLQSCSALCNPIDGSPPGSPVPGILQARTLEWVAISFSHA